jgi:hypothetical protein
MKERPILMSAPMVRALLAGTKTQRRRVVKAQPADGMTSEFVGADGTWRFSRPTVRAPLSDSDDDRLCRYGVPGVRLWVRETFKPHSLYNDFAPANWPRNSTIFYAADEKYSPSNTRWRPAIHMPRWASRITLDVTEVRVERLQDISPEDCLAEGIVGAGVLDGGGRCELTGKYGALWEAINGAGSWDANPWVWCVEFKRVG